MLKIFSWYFVLLSDLAAAETNTPVLTCGSHWSILTDTRRRLNILSAI